MDGGASYAAIQDVVATIATSDTPTTNYTMKIWGDVDEADNANIQNDEGDSAWITFSTTQNIKLSTGDGSKTVNVKIRDDVWNASSGASDSITLDTSRPVPNINVAPDATKISKISGKRTSTFGWQADADFEEYKIKVVPSSGSAHSAGTQIPTTNGSTNMSGTAGGYPDATTITSAIDGRDLELADSGDGVKIVKVFVKDVAGWSV